MANKKKRVVAVVIDFETLDGNWMPMYSHGLTEPQEYMIEIPSYYKTIRVRVTP